MLILHNIRNGKKIFLRVYPVGSEKKMFFCRDHLILGTFVDEENKKNNTEHKFERSLVILMEAYTSVSSYSFR